MQIPKEEIKRDILAAAEHEFLIRGYQNASLRTVAKKAKTTLGNLYNYFPNKEAMLDTIVGDVPSILGNFVNNHNQFDLKDFKLSEINVTNLGPLIDELLPHLIDIDMLLSNVVVILLEGCEGTKYESFKITIHDLFKEHMLEHLKHDPDDIFTEIIVQSIISSIIYVAKFPSTKEEKKRALLKYFHMLFYGLFFGTNFNIDPHLL
jgi:AcrR family transcriptional regulator